MITCLYVRGLLEFSISHLGDAVAETLHLDSISRQGTVFTHAYTSCPSCFAARRSLMTGQTPYTHGMVGYKDDVPWPYKTTLAGELTRAGCQTISIGKTHFHSLRLHLGFEQLLHPDDYVEWLAKQPGIGAEQTAYRIHRNSWMARPNHLPEHLMEETWLVSRARDFLVKRDPTRPFFLCRSLFGPHPPWCPPQVYYDQFIGRKLPMRVVGDWAHRHDQNA